MNDLKVIASDILPIYETEDGGKIVNARELHEQLLVGKFFSNWIKDRINKYGFVEGEDYLPELAKTNGRPKQEFWLTLDTAKEIAMVENNEQGRVIRKYFIKVEKEFRKVNKPKTQLEILQSTIDQMVRQEKEIRETKELVIKANSDIKNISNIMTINNSNWRKKVDKLLKRIADKWPGSDPHKNVRSTSYQRLEGRAGCNLSLRLKNSKDRAAEQGTSKTNVQKINRMDVIADDKRLLEIYIQVVKEMAIESGINIDNMEDVI